MDKNKIFIETLNGRKKEIADMVNKKLVKLQDVMSNKPKKTTKVLEKLNLTMLQGIKTEIILKMVEFSYSEEKFTIKKQKQIIKSTKKMYADILSCIGDIKFPVVEK
ncbi:hypothetical protein ACFL23_01235 [Patescibacteria group bacterium]